MTNHNYKNSLLALAAALIVSPGAFAEDAAEPAEETDAKAEPVCFNTDRVRNFDGLTDNFLYVEVNSKEKFLLSLRNRCFNLRSAQVIAFKNTVRRVCSNDSFVDIVVNDMGRPTSCRVTNIEPVESKEEAQALAADREAAMEAEKE